MTLPLKEQMLHQTADISALCKKTYFDGEKSQIKQEDNVILCVCTFFRDALKINLVLFPSRYISIPYSSSSSLINRVGRYDMYRSLTDPESRFLFNPP